MYRLLYFILALALAGCASSSTFTRPADLYHPVGFPSSYDALFADLFWRCVTPKDGGVKVEGYAVTSMRSNMGIIDFQVRLIALDGKGNILADRWKYGDLLNASNIEPVPFTVALPATGDVAGYDLYYSFKTPDGNGNGGGQAMRPRQGTRVRLVAGFDYFGTIKDVCGAKYRRKEAPPES